MTMLEKANAYIAENRNRVETRYRPRFHAVPPMGWINDPNGFYFDGSKYQLFYQHNPYDAVWNRIHWGHWQSADLLHWENLPVAMAPDAPYDAYGCFSGTAKPDGKGGAYVFYTCVTKPGDADIQQQAFAHFDGKTMTKHGANPVIPVSALPEGYFANDFRDPCLFPVADGWRLVMAARNAAHPHLVVFSSLDLVHWTFRGEFSDAVSEMPECPDVFSLDGKAVLLYSCVNYAGELTANPRPVVYSVGELAQGDTRFAGTPLRVLDYGTECYATQSCENARGERVLVSWMASWDSKFPTAFLGHGWSGMMTLPRIATLEGDRLVQQPVPALEACRADGRETALDGAGNAALEGFEARHAEIALELDVTEGASFTLWLMETGEEAVRLTWREDVLTLERGALRLCRESGMKPAMGMPLKAENGRVHLRAFVDACTVEVFANGNAMTALAFPEGENYGVRLESTGAVAGRLMGWTIR